MVDHISAGPRDAGPETRRWAQIFVVCLIVLAILVVMHYVIGEHENSNNKECQAQVSATMVARTKAATEERAALRDLIRLQYSNAAEPERVQAYERYRDAQQEADDARATNGSTAPLTERCER